MTPQLAMRVAILGGFAFALFAIIFFRLWFLQVLSGDDYIVEARENRVRKERIEAPRGDIVDRSGEVKLVTTRKSPTVVINPEKLPPRGLPRRRLYHRVGRLLNMSGRKVQREVLDQRKQLPYADVYLKTDVAAGVKNYIKERTEQFPGVDVPDVYLRSYPRETLAAQLFGSTREISPDELREEQYRGLQQGARIGAGGVEQTYDQYLRGIDGFRRYQVDALGQRKDDLRRGPSIREPEQGRRLRLSLDLGMQETAAKAVKRAIAAARGNGNPSTAGAYVAMNPTNGEVYALGSYPSFDANEFAKPVSQKRYKQIEKAPGSPLFNRALTAEYPTGSTFKPFTAAAALESGIWSPGQSYNDTGTFVYGRDRQRRRNAGGEVFGTVDLVKALQVSTDTFFYNLGAQLFNVEGQSRPLQRWARRFGFGHSTGIDIPNEAEGFVPDANNVGKKYREYLRCARKHKLTPGSPATLPKCGGYDRPFQGGDNVDLAIGQGKFTASPLQLATAYAAFFNGGRVVRPRVGLAIEDNYGQEVQKIRPAPAKRIHLSDTVVSQVRDGLRRAAMEEGGTSYTTFREFPSTVYGKTGTVERPPQPDQSWYAAVVMEPRPIVVVVTIEKGGFGAETAAPAARLILSKWLDVKPEWKPGSNAL